MHFESPPTKNPRLWIFKHPPPHPSQTSRFNMTASVPFGRSAGRNSSKKRKQTQKKSNTFCADFGMFFLHAFSERFKPFLAQQCQAYFKHFLFSKKPSQPASRPAHTPTHTLVHLLAATLHPNLITQSVAIRHQLCCPHSLLQSRYSQGHSFDIPDFLGVLCNGPV